jgi:DNA-binding IclR family transcriptional regulator
VGDQVRVLEVLESFHEVRMGNRPGRVIPPHCSSLGKAITAFQEARSMDAILDAYGLYRRTDRTIVERGALMREFEEIRTSGFACDREETVLGGVCFGAPISNPAGRVFAAISVSTPIVRMTPAREIEISNAVVETARRIETRLRGEEVE